MPRYVVDTVLRQTKDVTSLSDGTLSTVPIWPTFVLPVLTALGSGETLHRKVVIDKVAARMALPESVRSETLASGGSRYEERVGWALSNLLKAGWISRPVRATYVITLAGRKAIDEYPGGFDYALAKKVFAPYWPNTRRPTGLGETRRSDEDPQVAAEVLDPLEQIEDGVKRIDEEVGEELLSRLRESHPDFFEQAVVDLLLAMGYGGAEQRGTRIGGTGDEGIDGIIDQDALGLDRIYVQAKRYKAGSNISRETIQAFVGALHGFGATRGVFLTTSAFTSHAIVYADNVQSRVILIDGQRLVALMIKYRVGVQVKRIFTAVEIDADFFD